MAISLHEKRAADDLLGVVDGPSLGSDYLPPLPGFLGVGSGAGSTTCERDCDCPPLPSYRSGISAQTKNMSTSAMASPRS